MSNSTVVRNTSDVQKPYRHAGPLTAANVRESVSNLESAHAVINWLMVALMAADADSATWEEAQRRYADASMTMAIVREELADWARDLDRSEQDGVDVEFSDAPRDVVGVRRALDTITNICTTALGELEDEGNFSGAAERVCNAYTDASMRLRDM